MLRTPCLVGLALVLAGCASAPPITPDLRRGVHSVVFVQMGRQPLICGIDGADGRFPPAAGRRPETAPATVRRLLKGYPLVRRVTRTVMPALARAWQVPYQPADLKVRAKDELALTGGELKGLDSRADLALLVFVYRLNLARRSGAGDAAGTRQVRADIYTHMAAFRRQGDGRYRQVWHRSCWTGPRQMHISRSLTRLLQDPSQARALWADAAATAGAACADDLH